MKTHKVNKRFATEAECNKWLEENVVDNRYNGGVVLVVCMAESALDHEVYGIDEIWTA